MVPIPAAGKTALEGDWEALEQEACISGLASDVHNGHDVNLCGRWTKGRAVVSLSISIRFLRRCNIRYVSAALNFCLLNVTVSYSE